MSTSLSLRKQGCKSADYAIYTLFYTRKTDKYKPSFIEFLYKDPLELGFIY